MHFPSRPDEDKKPGDATHAKAPMAYRSDIDGLRAVAVLAVIAYHAWPSAVPNGLLGVDVFFVISGYLITTLLLAERDTGRIDLRGFYLRRARRILPALILMMLTAMLASFVVMQPHERLALSHSVLAALVSASNVYFWQQTGYFGEQAEAQVLLHTWSLGVEEQFYLLFPLLLLPLIARRRTALLLPIAFCLAVASLLLYLWVSRHHASAAFFLLPFRAWELLAGVCLASLHVRTAHAGGGLSSQRRSETVLGSIGLLSVLVGLTMPVTPTVPPAFFAGLVVMGTVALIHSGRCSLTFVRKGLSLPALVVVGSMSYSLYLWHLPLLVYARLVWGPELPTSTVLALLLVTAFVSFVSWKWVETPYRRPARVAHRSFAVHMAVASAVTAGSAAMLVWHLGLALPGTSAQRDLLRHISDFSSEYRLGTCFLFEAQRSSDFQACTDNGTLVGQTAVLWGDSYAAHLRPGLSRNPQLFERLVQRTASGCPPLVESSRASKSCKRLNASVWDELQRNPPSTLILAARWSYSDADAAVETVKRARSLGIDRVLVIGVTPQWRGGITGWLAASLVENQRFLETMTPWNFVQQIHFDRIFGTVINTAGAQYISAIEAMCEPTGPCRTSKDGTVSTLFFWDAGHLTAIGSTYLIGSVREQLNQPEK